MSSSNESSKAVDGAGLLKSFMRIVPQPVIVITTEYNNSLWGATVSSITSASLKPPLMMLSLDKRSPSLNAVSSRGSFVINLLSQEQLHVSDVFAGRFKLKDKFENVSYHISSNELPVLDSALATLECKVWKIYDSGDHDIILGEIVGGLVERKGRPIVYFDQSYAVLETTESAPSLYPL